MGKRKARAPKDAAVKASDEVVAVMAGLSSAEPVGEGAIPPPDLVLSTRVIKEHRLWKWM